MQCLHLEIFHSGRWRLAASLSVKNPVLGHAGPSVLDYQLDYVAEFLGTVTPVEALSCCYPVNFSRFESSRWPSFILDLMPSGAGRDKWLARRGLQDGLAADWVLLQYGAGSPPGNLRIREAVIDHAAMEAPDTSGVPVRDESHPGFERADIVARGEHFIEYAYQHGAATAGSSDIQGEAPKFLLVEDKQGRWHAEGAISDTQVSQHWLVKFPRGNTNSDRQVLRNEAAYLEVARCLGLKVGKSLEFDANALFIPRFDRTVNGCNVVRHGLESLCSAAAIAEYGATPSHELLLQVVADYSQQPVEDIAEYICRDVVNIVLGNKDNHARNMALLKLAPEVWVDDVAGTGTPAISLSPLYDFAPMYLDKAGIARVCRWNSDREQAGRPHWLAVVAYVTEHYGNSVAQHLRERLLLLREALATLDITMVRCGVDPDIITTRMLSAKAHIELLQEL